MAGHLKRMDKVHLEMEISTYLKDWEDDEEIGLHLSTDNGCIPIELEDVRDLARHFAEWGYLRAAEKYNEIEYNRQMAEESVPNDLGEAAKEYSKKVSDGHNYRDLRVGFIAGAKWQAEQMMKEAVEGTIDDCGTPARMRLEMPGGSFRIGDKVRIWDKVSVIVLPKEGEK